MMVFFSWIYESRCSAAHVAVIGPEAGMPDPEIRCSVLFAMLEKLFQSHLTIARLGDQPSFSGTEYLAI